uniref:Shisa family member 7 n=1 Tax=Tetraodon nigroviridis TaxID=99883 RepID=H3CJE0_TETNG
SCRGYYDVMGHYDSTFNCSKGSYIYCCGTCYYRFCCEHQRNRLDQHSCTNYISPVWANTQVPVTLPVDIKPDPNFETLQQQNSSTAYVIGGVISFTLVVAVGMRIAFSKVARRPRNRDIHMPRSLVDILRHQSSPVQQGERNNAALLTTTSDGRMSKGLYTPILQSKDNRTGNPHHHFPQQAPPPAPNTPPPSVSPVMRHSSSHHSFSHSFHNLAQLPPSYELALKPEISRYSSLKKLGEWLGEGPRLASSRRHYLPWGGDYTLGSRGTLPLNGSRPRTHIPPSTPNPYPLPGQSHHTSSSFDRPPRRVRSQDQLLAFGEGNSLSRQSKNQQHQYYKAMMNPSRGSNSQTLRRPSLDRHHMIKMNSHPTPGHDHDRASAMPVMGMQGGWDSGSGGHPNARRMAFASKRQNTIEQLHFIPGGGGGGQGLRTGSKNEVTV